MSVLGTKLQKSNPKNDKVKLSLKIKKDYIKIYFWTKWLMTRRGKKDGKKSIPYLVENNKWVSPTIQEENSKVNTLALEAYNQLCKNNINCFIGFECAVADFEQKVLEIERLHSFLKERLNPFDATAYATGNNSTITNDQMNMLNSQRKSEKDLEVIGVRLRRFNEYQEPYEPLRKRLVAARKELENTYKIIIDYYSQIELINMRLKTLYTEFCSVADIKISWYWQGVLKKHINKNSMILETPKMDEETFKKIFDTNVEEKSRKMNDVTKQRDDTLKLSIV